MKSTTKVVLATVISSALYGQTSTTNAPVYNISTVAGIASTGDFNPNDPTSGRANSAVLIQPDAVVFDFAGNMYVADSAAHRVRRVDAVTGVVTTVAGTGNNNYSATEDSGRAAVNARLNTPAGLAFDPAGNLYIVDKGNHRIRKVDSAGNITTVAGEAPINNNTGAPQNVNGGTTNGYAGDNRLATFAHLNSPSAISFDPAGNMYIADTANNRIRKVSTNGIISTFAGTGISNSGTSGGGFSGDGGPAVLARLNAPEGILADVNGNVFIGDTANNRVRLVTPNGIITTIAGACLPLATRNPVTGQILPTPCTTGTAGPTNNASSVGFGFPGIGGGDQGPATSAALFSPRGLALDVNGNLYIADAGNNRIRVVSPSGIISSFAGGGTLGDGSQALRASLSNPRFVAIDPTTGNVVIADSNNGRVRAVDPSTLVIRN
ncbi:MAG: hypothetical protein M3Z36_06105, partial [Acidobacteriota bacterium]|nr:hypothetical protein [Acidobacteriota bacterium]